MINIEHIGMPAVKFFNGKKIPVKLHQYNCITA
jgi:hypothetical protein